MIDDIDVLERVTLVAPLGVRFWDSVSRRAVSEGLTVKAHPQGTPSRLTSAFANRSGVYVLQHVPGLQEIEHGAGDEDFWANLPPKQRLFVIEVTDNEGRFQPFAFTVNLPVRGLFAWEDRPIGSPPSPAAGVPLFSAPTRLPPGGMAVIRAELRDLQADKPASWALLEARVEGQGRVRGLADQQGRIALIFPYPELSHASMTSPSGSPLGGGRQSLLKQSWLIHLQAFYSPEKSPPRIPHLDHVLNQAPAAILLSLSPLESLPEMSLQFGRELILKSHSQSVLFLQPAGSPP
jgi:hypothetical protein